LPRDIQDLGRQQKNDKEAAMGRLWICAGAANGFIAVALGALASHSLDGLAPEAKNWIEIGTRYELFHALALLAVALMARREVKPSVFVSVAGWAFLLGTVLFSGVLYAMALAGMSRLSALVPLGGVAFLIGWATLFFYSLSPRSR
jgi:uncharacterized membrane protein YgdD (TMEM256/DUF423 family)